MVRANRHEHSNVGGSANAFGAGGMVRANRRKHSNAGGSARSLRSLAEWCTPPEEGEGKRWAARGVAPLTETASSPPIFSLFYPACGAPFRETRQRRAEPPTNNPPFPFTPCAAHHSARRTSVERNLLLVSACCFYPPVFAARQLIRP